VQLAGAAATALTYTAFSTGMSTAVPLMAKSIRGNFQASGSYTVLVAGAVNAGIGLGADDVLGGVNRGSYDVPLVTPQTLYVKSNNVAATLNITVTSYEF
jgi:cellobiose-specific phosphotransferase system component IIB